MDELKPFMRIVLDCMPEDPNPVQPGTQGTFAGYDDADDLMVSWDNGSGLNLIPGVDQWHILSSQPDELDTSFSNLRSIQSSLPYYDADDERKNSSRCPRCGKPFDAHRGAVSRRIEHIMICDLCGQQEAIEDFLINGARMGAEVEITVPAGKNKTGFESSAEEIEEHSEHGTEERVERLHVKVKEVNDWYIVKVWQGRITD